MSDKPINNQNLIATRYGFISYSELIEKLDRHEKLETENARLREALEIVRIAEINGLLINGKKIATEALERGE